MYEAFFGLSRKPYSASPDPSMYVASKSTRRALQRLTYAVSENIGGFLLSGPAGCGKTLLLEKLASTAAANLEFLFIRAGKMNGDALAASLMRAAGLDGSGVVGGFLERNAVMDHIGKHFKGRTAGGKRLAIIIDSAEWIDNDGLGVLEMLNDVRRDGSFVVTFILSGGDDLHRRALSLAGLRDRFALSAVVEPLGRGEADAYINGRASSAGASAPLFDDDALAEIFVYSKGVPRRINRVCDLSLLTAFGLEKKAVDAEVMEAVIEELSQGPI